MKTAAIYARFSTDTQNECSITDQTRVCERLAAREGYSVVARYGDEAITGGTAQRPGYQTMLAAARRGEFNAILAEDLKRLWREQAEQWRAIKELLDLGVDIITASGIDSRQKNFEIMASVIGAAAELDRKEAAYRTKRGLEGKALLKTSTGGRAYGYVAARESDTGKIEIDANSAPIVRRIFEEYASGRSPRSIAADLNSEGVPSPGASWNRQPNGKRRDGKWLASVIHGDVKRGTGILNNTKYIGIVRWGRTEWKRGHADAKKRKVVLLETPFTEYCDERLRIVPQELWERVKRRQDARTIEVGKRIASGKRSAGGRAPRYLFSGLLRCAHCGSGFVKVDKRSYACSTYVNGRACTNHQRVRRDIIETRLLSGVRDELLSEARVRKFETEIRRRLITPPIDQHADKRRTLATNVDNMTTAIANGVFSDALKARLASTEAELAALPPPPASVDTNLASRRLPEAVARYRAMVSGLGRAPIDVERGREALREILGQVTISPDGDGHLVARMGLKLAVTDGAFNCGSGGRI